MSEAPTVTILHVDDNETNRYVTRRMLQNAGFTVLEAATGELGLQFVAEKTPDLVILDVKLPDLNGFTVCHRIKTDPATHSIPVLMLSAHFTEGRDKAQGLDIGADAYLVQPVEAIELLATVRALLRIRQAEESALSLAREWQTTFDSISDGIGLLDAEGRFLRCNQAMTRLLAKPPAEIIGYSHRELMKVALGLGDGSCFQLAKQTQQRHVLERQARGRWFSKTIDPIWDQQEALIGAVFILVDITDRKQAEATLRENEQLLQLALSGAHAGSWDWEIQSGKLTWSPENYDLYGLDPAKGPLCYEDWYKALHPEDQERASAEVLRVVKNRLPEFQSEFRIIHPQRGIRWLFGLGRVTFDTQGEPVRLSGIYLDVTERKQAEQEREHLLARAEAAREQAETANRIKDEFLAVLSHELRSPLNPILGWAKLLRSRKFDEAALKKALETIERNASLQAQLIEDLLDVSRILRGKLALNMTSVNLGSTVEAALETVRLAAEAKHIHIQTWLDPSLDRVLGDGTRLQQVVWNLLSNAIKFTPEGGQVTVQLTSVDAHAQLTICDTGKGINSDFLPHVFEYFRQADSTTTRRFGGLGLGLAIVRHLVELHGGTIWAASPGEDQGATFTLRLPLLQDKGSRMPSEAQLNAAPAHTSPSYPLAGVQILVVDDDADTRDFFRFVLEQRGAIVTTAASAGAALQALAQFEPDILLSDIGMPEMDGYMLMQQVRMLNTDQGSQIPAIALTAYAGETNQQQALAAGFQRHIAKPVIAEELIQEIANLVSRS